MFHVNGFTQMDLPDTSETIQISALALIKMLKHARSGVPMEVMGLMLGEQIDDYKIVVVDVFAMPQSGTGVTVEAVDPVYQQEMLDMLKVIGRNEYVVGWYHSHPGFGCWLSNVDISTQQSFEQLDKRAVALVVDPIQSVKGKVVLDAFRSISQQNIVFSMENRQITSNIGYLTKPTLVSLLHGLNRQYYSFNITYNKNDFEKRMLLNLHNKTWCDNLKVRKIETKNLKDQITKLIRQYNKMMEEQKKLSGKDLDMFKIGRADYRRELLDCCNELYEKNSRFLFLYSMHKRILS